MQRLNPIIFLLSLQTAVVEIIVGNKNIPEMRNIIMYENLFFTHCVSRSCPHLVKLYLE